jgi:anti-anti-sigma factor
MFDVRIGDDGVVVLSGRLDAVQADRLREAMSGVGTSAVVDFKELEYISSAGLGVLLGVQKRLSEKGHQLTLVNLNHHINEIFRIAGFDNVFEIR